MPARRIFVAALERNGAIVGLIASLLAAIPAPAAEDKVADMIVRSAKIRAGLCLHVGCGQGRLTLALSKQGRFLVYGLETDAVRTRQAQELIRRRGCYGQAWAEWRRGIVKLPLADNLVNLVVVDNWPAYPTPIAEVLRVMRPGGVAVMGQRPGIAEGAKAFDATQFAKRLAAAGATGVEVLTVDGTWVRFTKPWPEGMDQWTHARHGPDGNPVSSDALVAPPKRLRWLTGPLHKNNNVLTSAGRIYYGGLTARDAFNGLPLWKHEWAIDPRDRQAWYGDRLLMATAGDRVYFYFRRKGTLAAINGASGKTLLRFKDPGRPTQIMVVGAVLIGVDAKSVRAWDTTTGQKLWQHDGAEPRGVVSGGGRLYLVEGNARRGAKSRLVAMKLRSGRPTWHRDLGGWARRIRYASYHDGLLCLEVSTFEDNDEATQLRVVNAENGAPLWQRAYRAGGGTGMSHKAQARGLFADGLLWMLHPGKFVGLDPRSGKQKRTLPAAESSRCFPPIGTGRYLMSGADALTDLSSGRLALPGITKGTCGTFGGFVPANGLLYGSPKHCVCFPMLRGYVALAPARDGSAGKKAPVPKPSDFSAETGPANVPPSPGKGRPYPSPREWPAYRRGPRRSGHSATVVPADLGILWKAELGGRPGSPLADDWRDNPFVRGPVTAPVIAGGVCVVARPDAHEVAAFDAHTGVPRWRYTAKGRIDTPPTLYRGLCLFGTRSGFVTCLRLADGHRVWRLRAAPVDERIVSFGQVESPWPVAGSILVLDGVAYFAAGRQYRVDDGILVFAVDPATGRVKWITRANEGRTIRYGLGSEFDPIDLMVAEDAQAGTAGWVSFSRWRFDRKTGKMDLAARSGFAHFSTGATSDVGVIAPRGHWSYGPRHLPARTVRRPLVAFRGNEIYGCSDSRSRVFRRDFTAEQVETFKTIWYRKSVPVDSATSRNLKIAEGAKWFVRLFPDGQKPKRWSWLSAYNLHEGHEGIEAMVLTADKLFAVGSEGTLLALSTADGRTLARSKTAAPVWDGLAAAYGRVYLSTREGSILCLGRKSP